MIITNYDTIYHIFFTMYRYPDRELTESETCAREIIDRKTKTLARGAKK